MEMTRPKGNSKLKRDWGKEAIALALKGEWERATEVNQAILSLFSDDVDAMNRLGKAFMELNEYDRARKILGEVVVKAPYNTIAKKNLARLVQLENIPTPSKQARKTGNVSQLFIAESGKSGTTILQKAASYRIAASTAPGNPVSLVVEKNVIRAYVREDEYLGQMEPKLARRLLKLIDGGNRYEAAVIGVDEGGISIMIRETYRHPSLHNICSFPTASKGEQRAHLDNDLLRYLEESDLDDDDEEEVIIDNGDSGDPDSEWDS